MKTSKEYQEKYRNKLFFNDQYRDGISKNVQLHNELQNPLSSAAACINVLGFLNQNKDELIPFFRFFGLEIDSIIDFPTGINYEGEVYDDSGPIVFEWIGPKESRINEGSRGSRGTHRTSIDAFFLARIQGKVSQVFIEWKFTENCSGDSLHKFGGTRGIERVRRYSSILAKHRKKESFPFCLSEEDTIGISDFSYEPFYQLLRITLLAKETIPEVLGGLKIEDYYVLHLVHSDNKELLTVQEKHLEFCPGLLARKYAGKNLHDIWKALLTENEKKHFFSGYWNKALHILKEHEQANYLKERYM